MSLVTQIFSLAKRIADSPATTDSSGVRTFGEFIERLSGVSHVLSKDLGLPKGSRVVIFMDNSAEFYNILFACWAVGLCAVPLNSKLHPLEVVYAIQDSEAALCIVSQDKFVTVEMALLKSEVNCLLRQVEVVCGSAPTGKVLVNPVVVASTDPAWIFYTSGTTGKPKGAILTHRNLQSMCHAYYADIDRPGPGDTKLHAAPMSHGSGLYGLAHIVRGGHQVILSGFNPENVFNAIVRFKNVTLFAAPTMLSRMINHPSVKDADFSNLRLLYYGGGPMYQSDLLQALKILGPRLYHLYGQAEAPMTISGQFQRVLPDLENKSAIERFASCGNSRSGVMVKVVDDAGILVPPNVVGEILVRGDVVMGGYWKNPEATAKTVRDGWLHTGDLGAMDNLGYLTLKDRSKDLIISGGSNIYPREIEEILLRRPEIEECAVIGVPEIEWGEIVLAFLVLRPGGSFDRSGLEELLLQNLARFKRPRAYKVVNELPKNNYGKILKTDLREWAASGVVE